MAPGREGWVALPIDEQRFEKLFGTEGLHKLFRPKEAVVPTLDPAELGMEPVAEGEEVLTLDPAELLIEPLEPLQDPRPPAGDDPLAARFGVRPPPKTR